MVESLGHYVVITRKELDMMQAYTLSDVLRSVKLHTFLQNRFGVYHEPSLLIIKLYTKEPSIENTGVVRLTSSKHKDYTVSFNDSRVMKPGISYNFGSSPKSVFTAGKNVFALPSFDRRYIISIEGDRIQH